ncbi:hypothetical protein K2X85_16540 [bacterium]|nr:hypothetical protein [bacterium]
MTEFDHEVTQLVESLNAQSNRHVASILRELELEIIVEKLRLIFPLTRRGETNWEKAYHSSGPISGETHAQLLRRIMQEFRELCRIAEVSDYQYVTFISDDFYSLGIKCESRFAADILFKWLPLPHAIIIGGPKEESVLWVGFGGGASYVFIQEH